MARKTHKASLNIDGADELKNLLKNLPKNLQQKAAREATRRAAEAVMNDAKKRIHRAKGAYQVRLADGKTITRQPGDLAKALSMTHIPTREAPGKLSQHKVMFLRKKYNDIYKIAHLIEYGVGVHKITSKNGVEYTHPGHQAYPFLRPAVRSQKDAMYRLIKESLTDGIKEALGKK